MAAVQLNPRVSLRVVFDMAWISWTQNSEHLPSEAVYPLANHRVFANESARNEQGLQVTPAVP